MDSIFVGQYQFPDGGANHQGGGTNLMEFSLNVFTEFGEFSDKKIKIKNEDCGIGT